MTKSEKVAVQERAKPERCSQRRWIIDAIRAGLTREPQFGMKEIDALGESNYQLLAIGQPQPSSQGHERGAARFRHD
jgi:hypothetical protein